MHAGSEILFLCFVNKIIFNFANYFLFGLFGKSQNLDVGNINSFIINFID